MWSMTNALCLTAESTGKRSVITDRYYVGVVLKVPVIRRSADLYRQYVL